MITLRPRAGLELVIDHPGDGTIIVHNEEIPHALTAQLLEDAMELAIYAMGSEPSKRLGECAARVLAAVADESPRP